MSSELVGVVGLNLRPLRPEANARRGLPPLLLGLTCLAPSVDVRWRPLMYVAVVTHLVTHPQGRGGPAAGLGHPPWTGLAMPDVVRRLVVRGTWLTAVNGQALVSQADTASCTATLRSGPGRPGPRNGPQPSCPRVLWVEVNAADDAVLWGAGMVWVSPEGEEVYRKIRQPSSGSQRSNSQL